MNDLPDTTCLGRISLTDGPAPKGRADGVATYLTHDTPRMQDAWSWFLFSLFF